MDDELQAEVVAAGRELAAALAAGDAVRVRRLCTPDFWERAGDADFRRTLQRDVGARLVGVLGRRTLIAAGPAVLEQLWREGSPPLVEDQRVFLLADRAQVEASGDADRIARLQTKLDAQDAAGRLVEALQARDLDRVESLHERGAVRRAEHDLAADVPHVRDATLIGGVGPRTLVLVDLDGEQRVIEYLWRRGGKELRIVGARMFRLPGGVRA